MCGGRASHPILPAPEVRVSDRVTFTCNGRAVEVDVEPGESLLSVLRERLGLVSVKDGCAPQGQCGCCTVLVDGEPRVACVTPGRARRGPGGHDGRRARPRRCATGCATRSSRPAGRSAGSARPGSSCARRGDARARDLDRALAAHLCRCTGWRTVYDAIERGAADGRRDRATSTPRPRRAELEGGVAQRVGVDVPLGGARVRRRHRAARRARRGAAPARIRRRRRRGGRAAVGRRRVVARSARSRGGQGAGPAHDRRRAAAAARRVADVPDGGVRLATSWVEPAYLEPDASWCAPGGEPASPLANGGAFGGKAALARAARGARARRPARTRPCASSTRAKTSCASARSGRRSRRPRCGATARSRSTASSRAVARRVRATGRRRTRRRRRAAGDEVDVAGPPVGTDAARVRPRRAGRARRGRARRGRRRPRRR